VFFIFLLDILANQTDQSTRESLGVGVVVSVENVFGVRVLSGERQFLEFGNSGFADTDGEDFDAFFGQGVDGGGYLLEILRISVSDDDNKSGSGAFFSVCWSNHRTMNFSKRQSRVSIPQNPVDVVYGVFHLFLGFVVVQVKLDSWTGAVLEKSDLNAFWADIELVDDAVDEVLRDGEIFRTDGA